MIYECFFELFDVVFKMIPLSAHKISGTLLKIKVVCINNMKDRV